MPERTPPPASDAPRARLQTGPLTSEDGFLALLDRHFSRAHSSVALGRGDDAAIVACPPALAVSTDLFLEHAHFRCSYFSPADVGHKGLAVNLSDMAAMGARPLGFTLGLLVPDDPAHPAHPGAHPEYWDELLAAMAALAARWDTPLVGGDLSRAPYLGLSITIWGEPSGQDEPPSSNCSAEPGARPAGPGAAAEASARAPRRGACAAGDAVFVVGALGLARCGLAALERFGLAGRGRAPEGVAAHLRPEPLLAEGAALARAGVGCMMDVSDGLARDLPRLVGGTGAGLGVDLDPGALRDAALERCCRALDLDPVATAVLGGEDYALAGTIDPARLPAVLAAAPGVRRVGTVTAAPGLTLAGVPVPWPGFDHFSAT